MTGSAWFLQPMLAVMLEKQRKVVVTQSLKTHGEFISQNQIAIEKGSRDGPKCGMAKYDSGPDRSRGGSSQ